MRILTRLRGVGKQRYEEYPERGCLENQCRQTFSGGLCLWCTFLGYLPAPALTDIFKQKEQPGMPVRSISVRFYERAKQMTGIALLRVKKQGNHCRWALQLTAFFVTYKRRAG